MPALAFADALRSIGVAAVEAHRIHLLLQRIVAARGEIGPAAGFVQCEQLVDVPFAAGQCPAHVAVVADSVEMLVTVALGRPHECILTLQEMQVVVEIDPGRARFRQQRRLAQVVDRDGHEVEAMLVARLALEREAASVRKPIDAREVDIGVLAQVDPARLAAARSDHAELHGDIRSTRGRVALADRRAAIGIHLGTLDRVHFRFIVTFESDRRIVRRPPVSGGTVHLLLRDEFRLAIVHGPVAVACQLEVESAREVDHVEVLPAHERHVAAARRDLRVVDLEPDRGQRAQVRAGFRIEVVQPQAFVDAEQQLARVR